MSALPQAFIDEMKELLGNEYTDFLRACGSISGGALHGLRVNTLKISAEEFADTAPFSLGRVPWTDDGFYLEEEERPALHPMYAAGLYYIQEPSAMLPASALPVEPGERVLDLCAAPGGKAVKLAESLRGEGFIAANDISASRAQALLKNLELCGAGNILVTCETPQRLAARFEGSFDKVLVDAPCSGEGMLARQPSMARNRIEKGPSYYAGIQKEILREAAVLTRPGGLLLYSTCTFSVMENEGNVLELLRSDPGFEVISIVDTLEEKGLSAKGFEKGRPDLLLGRGVTAEEERQLLRCVRLYPHRVRGEGHFAALLRKNGAAGKDREESRGYIVEAYANGVWKNFSKGLKNPPDDRSLYLFKDRLYALPKGLDPADFRGLRTLRSGLYLGDVKEKRFEPSQPLAMSLEKDGFQSTVDFSFDDERVLRYLKGETLSLDERDVCQNRKAAGAVSEKTGLESLRLICAGGYPIGWGREADGRLKNRYRPGWRW